MDERTTTAIQFIREATGLHSLPVEFAETDSTREAELEHDNNVPKVVRIFSRGNKVIENIFHEFYHAVQLVNKKLEIKDSGVYWQGEINETKNYWHQPWESEARVFAREQTVNFNRFWREL